jgi:ATP-dependent DNA helicase RecQ
MNVIRRFKNVAKPRKTPTTLKTFDLYKEGLSPSEIAQERSLSITTIFSHLSQLYSEGKKIGIEKYVTK